LNSSSCSWESVLRLVAVLVGRCMVGEGAAIVQGTANLRHGLPRPTSQRQNRPRDPRLVGGSLRPERADAVDGPAGRCLTDGTCGPDG
jgi:hypothetical protein